jgi:hypothetical protein
MNIHQLTSLRQDPSVVTVDEYQSAQPASYMLTDYYEDRWCDSRQNYADRIGQQPMLFYKNYENACVVSDGTKLRNGNMTNKRYINQLNARPFMAHANQAPGHNNASKNPDLSSKLRHGVATTTYKPVENTSGVSIDRFNCLPEFGNPQRVEHIMEPWVRGGEHTRDVIRRQDHAARVKSKFIKA